MLAGSADDDLGRSAMLSLYLVGCCLPSCMIMHIFPSDYLVTRLSGLRWRRLRDARGVIRSASLVDRLLAFSIHIVVAGIAN